MKRLLLSLAMTLMLSASTACLAKTYKSIIIGQTDGTFLSIKGEAGMTLAVENNIATFSSKSSDSQITLSLDDVKSITLSADEGKHTLAATDEISGEMVSVGRIGDEIVFENLPAGSNVGVVSLAGKTLYSSRAEGSHTVDISSYAPGVYIVSYNKKSLKISITK